METVTGANADTCRYSCPMPVSTAPAAGIGSTPCHGVEPWTCSPVITIFTRATALLRRLEHEQHRPLQPFPHTGQHGGRPQQHRRVAVVAAGVRDGERAARIVGVHDRRGELRAAQVPYGQRVHVRAQRRHPSAGGAAPEHAHDTMARDPRTDLVQAEGSQLVRDQRRGPDLTVGELRVPVQMPAPGDDPRRHLLGPPVQFVVDRCAAHGGVLSPYGRPSRVAHTAPVGPSERK